MENKLPIKYKKGVFSNIKLFFSNFFKKKTIDYVSDYKLKENKFEISSRETEFEKMKAASNKIKIKEDILTLIEKKPQLIETLSIDRLAELEEMYDEIIEKNDRRIKQLKREIA